MERYDIYRDIAERTGGDIYIGVVGPVRTGKSTFISKFMEKNVLPNISGKGKKQVALDELPQSAQGKTVMTTEPKFVPGEAVSVSLGSGAFARVRMIDCVGFMVEGVQGISEDGKPRMVKTPWQSKPMPFDKAGETGTEKVIKEHSTIGIVVTTDGSFSEIERSKYVPAEERVINELKAIDKPFIVVLNSSEPESDKTQKLKNSLAKKYGVTVVAMSCQEATEQDFNAVLEKVLLEFPLKICNVKIPAWINALPYESKIIKDMAEALKKTGENACKMKDGVCFQNAFDNLENIVPPNGVDCNLGEGAVNLKVEVKPELFYSVLSEESGEEIKDEFSLINYVKNLSEAKKCYDKIKDAIPQVEQEGYGIVNPSYEDLEIGEPALVKRGSRYGVKVGAKSTSYHIMKIDIDASVTPLSGSREQCENYVAYLKDEYSKSPENLCNINVFGKKMSDFVKEGVSVKLNAMPIEARAKMKRTVSRIVNEGKGGVICILL